MDPDRLKRKRALEGGDARRARRFQREAENARLERYRFYANIDRRRAEDSERAKLRDKIYDAYGPHLRRVLEPDMLLWENKIDDIDKMERDGKIINGFLFRKAADEEFKRAHDLFQPRPPQGNKIL